MGKLFTYVLALGGVTSHEDLIRSDTVVMMSNFVVVYFFYWDYRMTIYIYILTVYYLPE